MDKPKTDRRAADHRRPTQAQIVRRMHELALAQANQLDVDEPKMVDPAKIPRKHKTTGNR